MNNFILKTIKIKTITKKMQHFMFRCMSRDINRHQNRARANVSTDDWSIHLNSQEDVSILDKKGSDEKHLQILTSELKI